MAKNNIGIAVALIGIVVIAFAFFYSSSGGGGGIIPTQNKIQCNVQVTAGTALLFPPSITNYNCQIIGTCLFGYQAVPFLLNQAGSIQLISGGSSSNLMYDLTLFGGYQHTYQLSVCSSSNLYTINLLDSNNQVLQTKTGTVS